MISECTLPPIRICTHKELGHLVEIKTRAERVLRAIRIEIARIEPMDYASRGIELAT